MPQRAFIFRSLISVVGFVAVAFLFPFFRVEASVELLVLLLLIVASQTWLDIQLPRRRIIMLSVTFTFITFLSFGALSAMVVTFAATLLAQTLAYMRSEKAQYSMLFVTFNAGQLALSTISAGLIVWLLTGDTFNTPPQQWGLPLLVYVVTFLVVSLVLGNTAAALSDEPLDIGEHFWSHSSLWTALCFAICGPLALLVEVLIPQGGTRYLVILTFAALMSLQYILRFMLRYEQLSGELAVINTVSSNLASSLDYGTLFPAIYDGIRSLMPVDAFFVALIDDERRDVRFVYLRDKDGEMAPRTLPYRGSMVASVIQTGQTLCLNNLGASTTVESVFGPAPRVRALMLTPLIAGDRSIGAIGIHSYAVDAYEPRHIKSLTSIGGMAAVAIHNAQLFEREKVILREREEFVSLVAHELKNPLTAISGYHQIAVRRANPDDEQLQQPLQVIAEQTAKLNYLVDDLLQLSRADAGHLTLHRKPSDIGKLVSDAVEQAQVQTNIHRLQVTVEPNLPLISIDVMRIGQVVQNLIGNAIKYSPEGGAIDVRVAVWAHDDERLPPHAHDQTLTHRCWMVVEVQDQGVGIPPRELPNVFARFFRANNNRGGEIAGVGLGLSIASEFVRAHSGLIWVESTHGEGSIFRFALPATEHRSTPRADNQRKP